MRQVHQQAKHTSCPQEHTLCLCLASFQKEHEVARSTFEARGGARGVGDGGELQRRGAQAKEPSFPEQAASPPPRRGFCDDRGAVSVAEGSYWEGDV